MNILGTETQVFLNYFVGSEMPELLLTDGIIGNRTREGINLAMDKLRKKFISHKFNFSQTFNFIGIRTHNIVTNLYDDWFVITEGNSLRAMPASTKAGMPAIKKYYNRLVNNIRGFGTIVENQQIDYALIRPNSPHLHWNSNWTGGLGFLFQDTAFRVYRDPNLDTIIDKTVVITSRNDGFNVHSWNNVNANVNWALLRRSRATKFPILNAVNNISEGCQVTTHNYWNILFPELIKFARFGASPRVPQRITYTLLQWD